MIKPTHAVVLGAGWIGAETAHELGKKWIKVRAVVHSRVTKVLESARKDRNNIHIFEGDLRCPETTKRALDFWKNTIVCAFAAQAFGATHTGATTGQPLKDFENNAVINENVLWATSEMGKNKIQSVAFSSSYFTYLALKHLGKIESLKIFQEEDLDPTIFTTEELQRLKTIQPYLWEKIVSERKYRDLSKRWIKIQRFRFGNVYWDGQRHIPAHPHLFPNLFAQRETFQMYGNGQQERAWIHVKDLVDGVLLCVLNESLPWDTLFNLGWTADNSHHSLKWVLEEAEKALSLKIHNSNPGAPGGQSLYLNAERAKNQLWWKPKITLQNGVMSTMDFYRKHWLGN